MSEKYDVLLMPTNLEENIRETCDIPLREIIPIYLSETIMKRLRWAEGARTVAYIKDGELRMRQIDAEEDENYFQFTGELSYELDD